MYDGWNWGRPARPALHTIIAAVLCLALLGTAFRASHTSGLIVALPATEAHDVPAPYAFIGKAYQPRGLQPNASKWQVAYVLVGRTQTVVLVTAPPQIPSNSPEVSLADNTGRTYPCLYPCSSTSEPVSEFSPNFSYGFRVTSFGPLALGVTMVRVHRNAPNGSTTVVPVNVSQARAAPLPIHPNITKTDSGVSVTLSTVARGAIMSEVDLSIVGLKVLPPLQAETGQVTLLPEPDSYDVRTADGSNQTVAVDGYNEHGRLMVRVAVRNVPPRSQLVLRIKHLLPLNARSGARPVQGTWTFNFRMP